MHYDKFHWTVYCISMMVQWLEELPHRKKVLVSKPNLPGAFLLPEAAVFLFCFHQRDLKIHPMLTTVSKHIINIKKSHRLILKTGSCVLFILSSLTNHSKQAWIGRGPC